MEKINTLIIGGGPAGLMAAVRASSLGQRVVVVEKNASVGEKLLISGRGRCNFTNSEQDMNIFISKYGDNGKFLYSAFSKFGPRETILFFVNHGVNVIEERGKRIFPAEGGSQKILDKLLLECKKGRVRILRNTPVKGLRVRNSRVECVITERDELRADKYIIATGGKSYPDTGSTGDGYIFAQQAGHSITKLFPALVPVRTSETWPKLASGCNLRNIRLKVIRDGKEIESRFGEMEFTNFGVSGPIVMELSSYIPKWQEGCESLEFSLDIKPSLTREILTARIKRDIEKYSGHKRFATLARGLVPKDFMKLMLELADIPGDKPVEYITDEEIFEFVNLLKDIRMNINGLWSFKNAVVTNGGVNLREVEPSTMRSKLCENLYFAGEVLDLNGPSGGFNLQICWSTGYVSGSVNE